MNRNKIFVIILFVSLILISIVLFISTNKKYNKMIIDTVDWNKITSSRKKSAELKLTELIFNDYKLFIDEDNSVVYYSIVDINSKFNPSFKFKTNNSSKIAFNNSLKEDNLETNNFYKIIIYNKKYYHEYSLCLTNYSLINIFGNNIDRKTSVSIELFDNHVNRTQKFMKSDARLKIDNNNFFLRLKKESIGRNKRSNPISILGFDKKKKKKKKKECYLNEKTKYVRLFINNKYDSIYCIEPVNIYER